jgi:hypothetical protein
LGAGAREARWPYRGLRGVSRREGPAARLGGGVPAGLPRRLRALRAGASYLT